jgi:hypothetical protein
MGETLNAEAVLEELLRGEYGGVEPDLAARVRTLLQEVRAEIATVLTTVRGAQNAWLRVDGRRVTRVAGRATHTQLVDAGEHTVAAESVDGRVLERRLSVRRGETKEIALDLSSAPRQFTPEEESSLLTSPWFWGAVAVVAAGATITFLAVRETTADPIEGDLPPAFP